MPTHSTSRPTARRLVACLVASVLLFQTVAPAVAIGIESHHRDPSGSHSSHHPGCPFDGKENCPHHRAAAGEPSLVQCGDGDALASGPTGPTLRLMATVPVQLFPAPDVSAAPAKTILPMLAWHTMTPETPPPRVPDSL
jgi:hypothetical protein